MEFKNMRRFLPILLILALALTFTLAPISAQGDAPQGTWLGTWPYVLPPDHHLNSFAAGGLNSNLGVVYRPIVELQPAFYMWGTDEYEPVLATSWGFTDDNTAYEMTLRDDATWSNGTPITSQDVVVTYALGRLLGWAQFNYIDDVEAVDEQTVRFHFIGDEPSLLAERLILKEHIVARDNYGELADSALELFESGATRADESWQALVTEVNQFRPDELIVSGPFTYSLSDVGDTFLTLRWQPNSIYSDTTNFGELRLWAGETDTTAPLVLSGELAHSTNVYPPSTIESFVQSGIELAIIPRAYGPGLLFQHDTYPWNIKEVRQATALIIDRAQSAFLTNGLGAAPTIYMAGILDEQVPLLMTEETVAQLDLYQYDPDRAAELLESVGFSRNADGIWADEDGNTISAEYKFPAEFADFSGAAQDAISQMNDFGYDITARALPWQESAADIRAGNFELSVWAWGAASPFAARHFWGPIQRFNYVDLADGQIGMNFPMEFEWEGEQINLDDMINNINVGLDLEEQRERASEVALIVNELMPYIPLNIMLSVEPFNTDLISGKPADDDPILLNPSGSGDHFIIKGILDGSLAPAGAAAQ
jgi:peptide/nickel transport system substrate-binding protein